MIKIKLAGLCMLFSSTAFSFESVGIKVDFEHSAKANIWTVSRDVITTDSVPHIVASKTDTTSGNTRVLKVTPTKNPNNMIELQIEYTLTVAGKQETLQNATIITKLGESAVLSSDADKYNDKMTIKITPYAVSETYVPSN